MLVWLYPAQSDRLSAHQHSSAPRRLRRYDSGGGAQTEAKTLSDRKGGGGGDRRCFFATIDEEGLGVEDAAYIVVSSMPNCPVQAGRPCLSSPAVKQPGSASVLFWVLGSRECAVHLLEFASAAFV